MAAYAVEAVEVWAGDILNKPGTLARVLEALSSAEAELEFLVARQLNENTSRVFIAPLRGKKQKAAATDVGLVVAAGMHALRIDGPDKAGLGARLTRGLAGAGINIRGMSAAALGRNSVMYLAFESPDEAAAAAKVVKAALSKKAEKEAQKRAKAERKQQKASEKAARKSKKQGSKKNKSKDGKPAAGPA